MTVILDTDRVSIIHGESLETLRGLPDKMFDVALFDPPYHQHVHDKFGKEKRTDGRKIPDALTFPPMTPELITAVSKELVRLTKTWIIATTDFYNTHLWGEAVRASGGEWVRSGDWVKTNPKPQMTGDRPGCGKEDVVICHASANPGDWSWNGGGHSALWRGRRDPAYGGDDAHPNQKPVWLMQSILGMFCEPGALVLDPYFGSGSTAIGALLPVRADGESPAETACPKCAKKILELYHPPLPKGVRVVGIEGDINYVDLAIRRIRETVPALLAA